MTKTEPIVVIGGGIIGTSLAYHLRDADRSVILCEQKQLLGGGTTRESIAMLGLSYPSPSSMRRYSRDYYHSLVDDGTLQFEKIGTLKIRDVDDLADLEHTENDLADLGHESELLEPDEVREFGVHPPEQTRTLHIPDEGYLDQSEIVAHWIEEARGSGVEVRTETPVRDIQVEKGAVTEVVTDDGTIPADTVVNAAGPWAPQINEMVDVALPLRHNHGPILVLETNEQLSLPNTSFPSGMYFREEGTTKAFAGRLGRSYADAERIDPDRVRSLPERFYLDVQALIEASIPKLDDARIVNEWMGLRTITPDERPIIGETAVTGYTVACGLNGMGITLAPAVGRDLAKLLTDGEHVRSLRSLAPARFTE